MSAEIDALLNRLEHHHGVRILYACESGSRAWGFASPDSDFDIRFIFAKPESAYLSVADGLESIDLPLEGLLDAGGWDVRKAVRLLGRSNGALVEWLHSPIVYREALGFRDRWSETACEVFSPRAAVDHYRGLAKQMVLTKLNAETVRAKDYLYALRSLLAARWVAGGRGIPPVPFADLLPTAPSDIMAEIPALLAHKAHTCEGEQMARVPVIDTFLIAGLAQLEESLGALSHGPRGTAALDRLLRAEIRQPRPTPPLPTDFTLNRVRKPDLLLFDTVAGSQAYGTALPGSDEDRRGVFVAPSDFLLGLDDIEQVADERGDEVYYEVGRLVEMLLKNNPNALELLAMPEDCVRFLHPLYQLLRPGLFLSKLCARTYGEYAMGQIRKARGLNKKIVNPQPEQRMGLLKFCHVPDGQGSMPLSDWLGSRGLDPHDCGVTAVQHATDLFAIYHGAGGEYRGLVSPKDPDALIFSSVPHDAQPVAWMHCNHDAFKAHCKAHREYWEWVGMRNEERYQTNAGHGRGYDSKNLMHTHRLLDMAHEIATEGALRVRRPNRDYLLSIRAGEFHYEDLVARAEEKLEAIRQTFERCNLPDEPDRDAVNTVLLEIRTRF